MKIVLITNCPNDVNVNDPSKCFQRVRSMASNVIECYDVENTFNHAEEADVILLPGCNSMWPSFWEEVCKYIDGLTTPKVMFHTDSYKTPWPGGRSPIKIDAIVPSQLSALASCQHGLEFDRVFWSPCCIDLKYNGESKDIDILFWGNPALPVYPFRNYILRELVRYSNLEKIENSLIVNALHLPHSEGVIWPYHRLPSHNGKYYGRQLYPLLIRAKVSPTGSSKFYVPVARYFENAACGVVSLTNEFDDMQALGFDHGVNIWITTEGKFIEDLMFLLKNESLVKEMSVNARRLVAERHTVSVRASQLSNFLEEVAK